MDFIVAINQLALRILFGWTHIFLRPKYNYKLDAANYKRGSILVANHQSRMDFFLIHTGIPLSSYIRMVPIYQLIVDTYMDTWWKRIFLSLGGCIAINVNSKFKSTVGLLNLLEKVEKGNSVLIFPEGKVVRTKKMDFFSGIGYLLHKSTKPVIPIYLDGFRNITPSSFLFRRHNATIVYGRPMQFREKQNKKIARNIMRSIYSYGA